MPIVTMAAAAGPAISSSSSSLGRWTNLSKSFARATASEVLWFVRVVFVLALCCNTLFIGLGVVIVPFLVLETSVAMALLAIVITLYLPTYIGDPASTGRRRWTSFRRGFIIRDIIKWFSGDVVKTADLPADQQYIFAFAPHGIMVCFCFALWSPTH